MRLVIIGGDAAGMSAASEARRRAPDAEIIVLEATQDVSYGACGLPYKLSDEADMEDLSVVSADQFRTKRNIDLRLGHRVEHIRPDQHEVSGTASGQPFTLRYDRLVIATGARATRPPIDGLDELWGKGVYGLKTLQDGRELKQALVNEPTSVAVIGGGYVGLEATENLREIGTRVTLIEALDDLVPFLPEAQRKRVLEEAARHAVDVRTGTKVLRARRISPAAIELDTTSGTIRAELLLVATGVRPNAELAAEAGLTLGAPRQHCRR